MRSFPATNIRFSIFVFPVVANTQHNMTLHKRLHHIAIFLNLPATEALTWRNPKPRHHQQLILCFVDDAYIFKTRHTFLHNELEDSFFYFRRHTQRPCSIKLKKLHRQHI